MKTKLSVFLLFVLLTSIANIFAQSDSACDSPECHQFDFWIGNWKATWQDSTGSEYIGANSINKILGGCVIAENFDGNPGVNFTGKSFSVFSPKENIWKQTWVDSQGGYMLFSGGMEDNKMILFREVETKKGMVLQRMVFYNITKDSFDWNWEASFDNGMNWKLNWLIHYLRK